VAKKYKVLVVSLIVFILLSIAAVTFAKSEVDYSVHFIDTGQSDCILIKGGKKNYLIDTGDAYYSNKIIKYLDMQNVNSIDTIILTHYHDDHYGCLNNVMSFKKVSKVYIPMNDNKMKAEIYKEILMNHVVPQFMTDGWELNEGKVHLKAIAPENKLLESENNKSIIIYGEIDGVRYFFASDCEKLEQKYILRKYDIKECDVLKFPHHGINTGITPEMLKKLKPKATVVTCNGIETPDENTIKKIKSEGIKVFRYDKDGSVIVKNAVLLTTKSYKKFNLLKK
jgi:competence protein ComEC